MINNDFSLTNQIVYFVYSGIFLVLFVRIYQYKLYKVTLCH
nr:MAG TPA: hypothetical protein [Caudoviricetes sp.]